MESLERRYALATLVSATKLTYQDADGDNVSVVFSKPILNAANINDIFTFDSGAGAVNGSNTVKEQLQVIDLTGLAAAAGTSIMTKATMSAINGGDGFAALGDIRASGLDLGVVTIDGDLGRIRVGDINLATSGMKGLTTQSLGLYGTSTGALDLSSGVEGELDFLTVKSDIKDVSFAASNAGGVCFGKITIGGSLIGGEIRGDLGSMGPVMIKGSILGATGDNNGSLHADQKIASVTVGGSVLGGSGVFSGVISSLHDIGPVKISGNLVGGNDDTGAHSGMIYTYQGNIDSVTIGGSLIGGATPYSGMIKAEKDLGPVKIGHDVIGGSYFSAGAITSGGNIANVTIGGSLVGDSFDTAKIEAKGNLGVVKIAGDVVGGDGDDSGFIHSIDGTIASVTIGGSLLGGTGENPGVIDSFGNLGPVSVKKDVAAGSHLLSGEIVDTNGDIGGVTIGGSLFGGPAGGGRIWGHHNIGAVKIGGNIVGASNGSAKIFNDVSGTIASVTIGGSIQGGYGNDAGSIYSEGDLGPVKIGKDVAGGSGLRSGAITAKGKLATVSISGSLLGGTGDFSGDVISIHDAGSVKIGGDVVGGDGDNSGQIHSYGKLTSLAIGGSLVGGAGNHSGNATAEGNVESLSIGRDLIGGSASPLASLIESGFVAAKRIGKVSIGGSLIAGVNDNAVDFADNGAIRADDDLGSITINGNLVGNKTNPAIISARGQAVPTATTDLAIGALTVKGRVEWALILAGVDPSGDPANADAQIGPVSVGGDWIASSLAAGALPGLDEFFGNGDDAPMSGAGVKDQANIFSKIVSLKIGHQALGSLTAEHFSIVAQNVGSVKVGATQLPLVAGNSNDDLEIGITGNFRAREI